MSDEEETMNRCMICLNDWLEQGPHRVVSLKCGHIFGRDCIYKWLNKEQFCPICKDHAKREDIRMLYLESQSTNKTVKTVKKYAKGKLNQVQKLLGEEKRKRIQAERELLSLKKSVVDVLRGKKSMDNLKHLLEAFQYHPISQIKMEMKFFDFQDDAMSIAYGKHNYVSLENYNLENFEVLDLHYVMKRYVLFCNDATRVVNPLDMSTILLKFVATCIFMISKQIYIGSDTGNVHILDKDWKTLAMVQFQTKIFSIVATEKFILVALGKYGASKYENGKIEKIWSDPCYSITFDSYSKNILVCIEKLKSVEYHIFTDLDQIEIISMEKPPIMSKSIMESIGIADSSDQIHQIVSLVDYGNFVDIDEEIPMYTLETTLIVSVFDNLVLMYDLNQRILEQTLNFSSKVECIRFHQDVNGTHLGVLTRREFTLYKLN